MTSEVEAVLVGVSPEYEGEYCDRLTTRYNIGWRDVLMDEDPLQDLPDWVVLLILVFFLIGAAYVLFF